jgi:hypothetical protein
MSNNFQFAVNGLRFEDIRNQIIQYLQENSSWSGSFDFKGSNIATMIDTMSYVTMLLSYQVANIANNSFLDSTNVRKNAVSLSKNIGYKPKRPVASKLSGTFKYYGENFAVGDYITMAPFSSFLSSKSRQYLNIDPIVLKYTGDPKYLEADYMIHEGSIRDYYFYGTGLPLQNHVVPVKNVDENIFTIYVYPSNVNVTDENKINYKWNYSNTFSNLSDPTGKFYFLEEDLIQEGCTKIIFGDGNIGIPPDKTNIIHVEYLETVGYAANGEYLAVLPEVSSFYFSESLKKKYNFKFDKNNFDTNYLSQYNLSYGGADLETIDSIKSNAPKFFSRVGRLVTKNDYYNYLQSQSATPVRSINVVGQDEFIIEGLNNYGVIYITAVPYLPPSINNAVKLYLTELEEKNITTDLQDISIISTSRQFFKPSYVYLDVFTTVEMPVTLSLAEQTEIKNNVKTILENYFLTNYQNLGTIFRKSKLNSSIDGLPNLISSDIGVGYYFLISKDSLYAATSQIKNNFIYLPLIGDTKDYKSGLITAYRNFVKTMTEIVDDQLASQEAYYAEIERAAGNQVEVNDKRLQYMNRLLPSQSSIYGTVYHPFIDRWMYNVDISHTNIVGITTRNNISAINTPTYFDYIYQTNVYQFYSMSGNLITPVLQTNPDSNIITKSYDLYFQDVLGSDTLIGTISFNRHNYVNPVSFTLVPSGGDILERYGIIKYQDEEYISVDYNDVESTFYLNIRLIGNKNTSDIRLNSENVLFRYNQKQIKDYKLIDAKTLTDTTGSYPINPAVSGNNITFTYNDGEAGLIDKNLNIFFKSYISTQTELNAILATEPTTTSFYTICNKENILTIELIVNNSKTRLEDSDIIFFDINATEEKKKWIKISEFNKTVSYFDSEIGVDDWVVVYSFLDIDATLSANLLVNYKDGDVLKIIGSGTILGTTLTVSNNDIIYFDTTAGSATNYFTKASSATGISIIDSFAASAVIVTQAVDMDIKLVVNLSAELTEGTDFDGKTQTKFFEDDLIMYKELEDDWVFLCNTATASSLPNISCTVDDTYLTNIASSAGTGDVYYVNDYGYDFNNSNKIVWSQASEKIAEISNLLVYIGNDTFVLYDESPQFLASADQPELLPIYLERGSFFSITASGNFAGTLIDTYSINDRVLYLGDNKWNQIPYTGILTQSATAAFTPSAEHMNVMTISKEGNFESSTKIKEVDTTCYFTDKLIYINDGSYLGWYKLNEYSAHIKGIDQDSPTSYKVKFNEFGFNSDIKVIWNPTLQYYEVIIYDIYHGSYLGTFNYNTGKMVFSNLVKAKYDKATYVSLNDSTCTINSLFNNYDDTVKFDKIKLIPVNKINTSGTRILEEETDFDTLFNQYVVANINTVNQKI